MMADIRVVLVPVTPLPAAICPGELRTAQRSNLLAGLGKHYGELIVSHLINRTIAAYWQAAAAQTQK
jgi:hypothetical protein